LGGVDPSHRKARREPVTALARGGGQSPTAGVLRRKTRGSIVGFARQEAYRAL